VTRQFICMKWGDRYSADYVNRLYGMIRRQTPGDIRVVCLTDDPTGIRDDVDCFECPEIAIPAPQNRAGWRKVTLFAERVADLTGDVLFIDLDVVITGSLDDFFTFEPDRDFIVMENPTQSGERIGNTSIYRFKVGSHPELLQTLLADPEHAITTYRNSQTFISRTLGDAMAFWPRGWCVSFKVDCLPGWPRRLWKPAVLPEGARLVIFPGKPDPDEAAEGHWPEPRWRKKLYKTLRPVPWIAAHWAAADPPSRG